VPALSKLRADILVTHEAPSCHPYGFAAIDALARAMGVVRSFHGHQHDDQSDAYAKYDSEVGKGV
jgi:cytosine/adenosine deaminase-related metal-dependent hydrolase